MATVDNPVSGAPRGQTGDSGAPPDLAGKISRTEGELDDVKKEIKELKERDVEIFVADWRFSSREKLEAALLRLEHKEELLNDRLNTYEARLTAQQQQQQQSGAGASVLPVRQEVCLVYKPVLHTPGSRGLLECVFVACWLWCSTEQSTFD